MFNKIKSLKNLIAETFTGNHGSIEFELLKTDHGLIYEETAIIERIAERTARAIKGIHKASAVADKPVGTAPLKVRFNVVIKQNYSANDLSEKLIGEVKKNLDELCGIMNATVDVKITDVERSEINRRVK